MKQRGSARDVAIEVELYEMRPVKPTPAHETDKFAELVCSNSLKSESENTAPWLLKEEMRRVGSLLLRIAHETSVPAGHALAVDRDTFAAKVTEAISAEPNIKVIRQEFTQITEEDGLTVIATGPLTSDALSGEIRPPLRQQSSIFLRFHQSNRRSRFHRHEQGLHGGALQQRHCRLH